MAPKSKKPPGREKKNVLDRISPSDALEVLKILANEDKNIARRIEQIAIEHLSGVDIEDVASAVFVDLDSIDVEEVWDRSGSTRHGYMEPTDMAWQMFEEALESFLKEFKKYQELSMHAEAKNYCMGILKGIYMFAEKSKSEYKNWAVDAPAEYFQFVLDQWKKGVKNRKDIKEVEDFIAKYLSDW